MISKLKMMAVLASVVGTVGLASTASARELGPGRAYDRHVEHERAGRWAGFAKVECGLHVVNG